MKINQIIVENFDGEYDDEAGMAQTNLHTIARAAQGLLDTIDDQENLPEWVQEKIAKVEGMMVTAWDYLRSQEEQGMDPRMMEAANAAQQAAIAISMKKAGKKPKNESTELEEEFDLIESIIERLAEHNGVDAEVIWEDLETLTEDELYAFAVTSEPIMESQGVAEGELDEAHHGSLLDHNKGQFASVIFQSQWDTDPQIDYYNNLDDAKFDTENASAHHGSVYAWNGARWVRKMSATERNGSGGGYGSWAENKQGMAEDWQKANKRDKTDGMSQKAVNAYRRENPGSKLKTAVTTKPGKLKKGGKASKRRKSYCSRSRGQMKMHSISCAKTPDKAICKARRRWNC
jgi:hypothetical protein